MTFEFSNHVVKYDMPTLVNCARYGVPIPDDTCVLLGQALLRNTCSVFATFMTNMFMMIFDGLQTRKKRNLKNV